jgi:hypothetical protein
MSRKIIITDIIPIVVHIMNKQGANLNSETHIRDENLIQFFEEELIQNLSICGSANHCTELEEAIKEWLTRDKESLYEYIKFLLNKYVNLQLKIRNAQKLEQKLTVKQVVEMLTNGSSNTKGPPDSLTEFRKQNPYGPNRWIRKKEEN